MWRTVLLLGLVALLLSVPGTLRAPIAAARPGKAKKAAPPKEVNLRPPPGMRSRSLNYVWEGRLLRGMKLRQSEYVHYVGEYQSKGHFYGTWEMVQLLERAARRVAFRLPGAKLSIGELSRSDGGQIAGHRSHEAGRDVDIGFYTTTGGGKPYHSYAFADIAANGRGAGQNSFLRFDDARNWELIAKLVADGETRVQYIFVADTIRSRLLREATRRGAAPRVIERAKAVLVQPSHGHPHRNHFHMRIYCAPADRPTCKDQGPFWPWYPGVPPGGVYNSLRRPLGPGAL